MRDDPLYREAIERFQQLFDRARQTGMREPAAMTLATADADGRPSARIVLLRGVDERGFVFYTNSHSSKGRHLADNPHAALCLYWDELREQVRVEGDVEIASDAESDAYWSTRQRESQIGAWASAQSSTLDDRQTLRERVAHFEQQFAGRDVPRPPHWRGYRVLPVRIEFWTSQPARLHKRDLYEQQAGGWTRRMLFP